jgi:hypothetical protein
MAKPAVPLGQRLAARTTTGGKAAELGTAALRGTASFVDKAIVPGAFGLAEYNLISAGLGQLRDREIGLPAQASPAFQRNRNQVSQPGYEYDPSGGDLSGLNVPRTQADAARARSEQLREEQRRREAQQNPGPLYDSWMNRLPSPGTTPPVDPGLVGPDIDPGDALTTARIDFEEQMAALNAGFENMFKQIRSMYKLSETEEEKELLRFQLADLEKEYEAGTEAIGTLYAEKTQTIQALAARSRTDTTQASQAAEQNYSQAAIDLMALQESRNAAQVQSNRGLGIGPSQGSPYEGLLQSLAPIAGQYAQRIGDIGSEGLDYLSGLNESMGAARQGELQSLYAGTRAGTISGHVRGVIDRVATERLAMASALTSGMSQQLSAQQRLAGEAGEDPTPVDYWNVAENLGRMPGMTPEAFSQEFFRRFGRLPDEHIMNHFMRWRNFTEEQNRLSQEDRLNNEALALLEQYAPDLFNFETP